MISWLAYAEIKDAKAFVRAPHQIAAHKGLDGIAVELHASALRKGRRAQRRAKAVIWEDKATSHPRKTLREEVWPSFKGIEAKRRDDQILAEVSSLLSGRLPDDALRLVLRDIFWRREFGYRVAITTLPKHGGQAGRKKLFRGYDTCVKGECHKRRAETFEIIQLRTWMTQFCGQVADHLEQMKDRARV